jgi:hypothetical protein
LVYYLSYGVFYLLALWYPNSMTAYTCCKIASAAARSGNRDRLLAVANDNTYTAPWMHTKVLIIKCTYLYRHMYMYYYWLGTANGSAALDCE